MSFVKRNIYLKINYNLGCKNLLNVQLNIFFSNPASLTIQNLLMKLLENGLKWYSMTIYIYIYGLLLLWCKCDFSRHFHHHHSPIRRSNKMKTHAPMIVNDTKRLIWPTWSENIIFCWCLRVNTIFFKNTDYLFFFSSFSFLLFIHFPFYKISQPFIYAYLYNFIFEYYVFFMIKISLPT